MSVILSQSPSALERTAIETSLRDVDGVRVISAGSLSSASDILARERVDMVISDVFIFDAPHCEMIASIKDLPDPPQILVISSAEREYVSSHAWRLGVDDFLLKPYRSAWLVAAVTEMLRGSSAPQKKDQDRSGSALDEVIARISDLLDRSLYSKCTDAAKKYLDELFLKEDNPIILKEAARDLVERVSAGRNAKGDRPAGALERELARFERKISQTFNKYDVFASIEKIIDLLLDDSAAESTQRVINFIDRSAKRGVSLNEAAEFMNMSSYYFSKFFKRMTGVNFISYVTDRRMDAAKMMLEETDLPIINIASELSFNETNYFSKAFRKWVGMTPTEFRERSAKR